MNNIINISGYRFVYIYDTQMLRANLREKVGALGLKGSVIVSPEGINIMLAGTREQIELFYSLLAQDSRFADIEFKETISDTQPFEQLLIKRKNHIVPATKAVDPIKQTAPHIEPEILKQWLDEGRDIVLLDTRNRYEIDYGTFDQAVDFELDNFREFSAKAKQHHELKDKTVVMFCTGGIRCEKAGPLAMQSGFKDVYQLSGGIIDYFAKCGTEHYHGSCFVFDQREAISPAQVKQYK